MMHQGKDAVINKWNIGLVLLQHLSKVTHYLPVSKLLHMIPHVEFASLEMLRLGHSLQVQQQQVVTDHGVTQELEALALGTEAPQQENKKLPAVSSVQRLKLSM